MISEILLQDSDLSDNRPVQKTLDGLPTSPLSKDNHLSDNQQVQKTLDGFSVSPFPKVRTTDGFMVNWDRNIIVNQLLKETKLSEIFYNKPTITKGEAIHYSKRS